MVQAAIADGALEDEGKLLTLWFDMRSETPPDALLDDIVKTVQDRYLGLEALALASLRERSGKTKDLHALPARSQASRRRTRTRSGSHARGCGAGARPASG